MLTCPTSIAELRRSEFARLDAEGVAYLDYGGSALHAESQLRAHAALLSHALLGNPHSAHGSSRSSTRLIDAARQRVRAFVDAGDDYAVIFTANATAAIKLVAEAFPFDAGAPLILTADNHNSVNGTREFARRAGATTVTVPLAEDLTLADGASWLQRAAGRGLFAFPAQSNFSGVCHPLSLVRTAQAQGHRVLLDAAAYVTSHPFSLRTYPADFAAVSFYKMFGYPTGVGALLARRDALAMLRRPWFSGGTIDYASVQLDTHRLRESHEAFEDGTANFAGIAGVPLGLDFLERVGMEQVRAHTAGLTRQLLDHLRGCRHRGGQPLVRIYGPTGEDGRGGCVAFNVLSRDGDVLPYQIVEQRADASGVQVRGGCFCNPGASEAAFRMDPARLQACFDSLGADFSILRLQRCLGRGATAGAVRASVGVATTAEDVHRLVQVVTSLAS